jgi:hypothetical protein
MMRRNLMVFLLTIALVDVSAESAAAAEQMNSDQFTQASIPDLCANFRETHELAVLEEITKRANLTKKEAFMVSDWRRLSHWSVGVREVVFLCAMGMPDEFGEVIAITTKTGEPGTRYRYIHKGRMFYFVFVGGALRATQRIIDNSTPL